MTPTDDRIVTPSPCLRGTIRVPGDKSVSHRVAMLAALAAGDSTIEGFLAAEDCCCTLAAMSALGANVARDGETVRIRGVGGRFAAPADVLDMGNSGTGMRLLCGLLAAHPFTTELTGDASLRSRPMRRIKEPLEQMGAKVDLLGPNGCAPIRIGGGALRGIRYATPVASAQVKSCILLAGLFAEGRTEVVEPKPTRDHTERMLRAMGVGLTNEAMTVSVRGTGNRPLALGPTRWRVPGDFSSAAFWLTAAACRENSEVTVEGVGLNPRRTALLDVLRRMGAEIQVTYGPDDGWEPVGSVVVRGARLKATEVGGDEVPNLIDELPLVAVAGAMAVGTTVIRDAAELRVKESDRIAAMACTLTAFGVEVTERPDGLVVKGRARLDATAGLCVHSRGDHRIAMASAVLALMAPSAVRVEDIACVQTSYPTFWDHLTALSTARPFM